MNQTNRHRYTSDVEDEIEMDYDEPWPTRLPSSSYRYDRPTTTQGHPRYRAHPTQLQRIPIPARRSAQRLTEEPAAPTSRHRRSGVFRSHPLMWVGFGMLAMLLAWTGLQALGAWWSVHQDDVTYGRPRSAQYEVVVGHDDSPGSPQHFLALNLNGQFVLQVPSH